jgi:molecular chaperone GrpE
MSKHKENAEETSVATSLNSEESENESIAPSDHDSAADEIENADNTGGDEHETPIELLEKENIELKDQLLRKQADFENYRKRMIREREQIAAFANQQIMLDLLPIIDDFERAINSTEESKDFDAFHSGILLIEQQFTNMLERKWGLTRFDSVGDEFDPEKHEAVLSEPNKDSEASVVLEDYQKGYMLKDRVLRASKVKVSLPVAEENTDGAK